MLLGFQGLQIIGYKVYMKYRGHKSSINEDEHIYGLGVIRGIKSRVKIIRDYKA
jgi:hypothetical protein